MGDPGRGAAYSIRDVAERANVPEGFVRRLVAVGALPSEKTGLGPREVGRVRLLHSWKAAGLSIETIVALADRGAISLRFLDTPVMATPERLDRSYEQLAADRGVPLAFLQALHQAIGFAPPDPADRAGEDDVTMLDVEEALERSGLQQRVPQPPAICFVDLTGYTQLTEQSGDEVAAQVAGTLASLVKNISRDRGGRPIRWLGDGGMFHFREPWKAVVAGLDMVERAPAIDLPPAHVGIHTGPVISQDGDVYGRTVNLAARIAAHARAGQVVVSEETARRSGEDALRFEPLGPVDLKGVAQPVLLYQAFRNS
jgi:class 3 adenylate cyclase